MEHKAKQFTSLTKNPSKNNNIFADYSPFFRVYEDGKVERLNVVPPVPPSYDQKTGVESKDRIVFPKTGVSVRMFNPIKAFQKATGKKMPLVMYCHGSGFCSGSTFSPVYHRFLNCLASKAEAIVVSVEYRKATEYPLPAAYDDCLDTLLWIMSHDPDTCNDINELEGANSTKEPWLESGKVDFSRVFVGGESSGANVAHQVALQAGLKGHKGMINGLILIQPFFWGTERIGDEVLRCKRGPGGSQLGDKLWAAARWGSPASVDDPWMNPSKDTKLASLGCQRVLICLAQEDALRDRGLLYEFALKRSNWIGDLIVKEAIGEDHAFHLVKPYSSSSMDLMRQIQVFINLKSRI